MQYFNLNKLLKVASIISLLLFLSCKDKIDYVESDYNGIKLDSLNADKFIAHAGGAIGEYAYTNSLEALNYAYNRGAKLFELDILSTYDNKYVAAHYWENYKEMTDYSSIIDRLRRRRPLTEKEFSSRHIYKQFTPLNMERINQWFGEHPDAILITDKINSPKQFTGKGGFAFKDRLIMELFSWEAVDEALKENIIPMPSENLIAETENIESKLKELGIVYIAVSIDYARANKELFRRLKEQGIKTYVFLLHYKVEDDEKYVWENMDYIYGMYADNFDLAVSLR